MFKTHYKIYSIFLFKSYGVGKAEVVTSAELLKMYKNILPNHE